MTTYIDKFFGLKRQQQKNQWVSCVPTANAQTAPHSSHGQEGNRSSWDVTIVDTHAESHIRNTATLPGEAANTAAAKKRTKYIKFDATHTFFPVAIETAGKYNNLAIELIHRYQGTA